MEEKQFFIVPSKMTLMTNLVPRDVLVYLYLKCYDNNKQECFPSLTTLSKRSGASRDTIQKSIDNLVQEGYVSIEKRGRSNYYKFTKPIHFDKFYLEFIDNPDLTFNEKSYLVALYPYMFKDKKPYGMTSIQRKWAAKALNISESTVYRLNKSLSRKEVLQIFKEAKKDLETGCSEELWVFNLQRIGQAALWLIEKNSEDVDDLKKKYEMSLKENAELRKTMEIIMHEVAELKKQAKYNLSL